MTSKKHDEEKQAMKPEHVRPPTFPDIPSILGIKGEDFEKELELKLEAAINKFMGKPEIKSKAQKTFGSAQNKVKGFFSRVGFHALSLGAGLLGGLLAPATSSLAQLLSGSQSVPVTAGALIYLSLLLLFPPQSSRVAAVMGIVVAVAFIFTGYWPLGMALGGVVAFIINAINRRKIKLGSFFALLLLAVGIGRMDGQSLMAAIPLWYSLLLGGAAALGVIFPHKISRLVDQVLFKLKLSTHQPEQLEKQQEKVKTTQKIAEKEDSTIQAENSKDEPAKVDDGFDASIYLNMLKEVAQFKTVLPLEMVAPIQMIENKTQAILKSMKDDSRDVVPGKHFLNRYLPMIKVSVERFIRLSEYNGNAKSAEFEQVKDLTLQSLNNMSHAFQQMHQRLLDNNVDDLMVNLKVMDRLLKSEGYDLPPKP